MGPEDVNPLESRTPQPEDLADLCRSLNEQGARYLVVGGFAMIQHGLNRTTDDIDILLEPSAENQKRVLKALEYLPDKAVREVQENDLNEFLVVRVADEIVVDLMLKTCGIDFITAEAFIEWHEYRGVRIPFASPSMMLKMKQTYREKDALDRQFLHSKLQNKL